MGIQVSDLWRFDGKLDIRPFAILGALLLASKMGIEQALAHLLFHYPWPLFAFVNPNTLFNNVQGGPPQDMVMVLSALSLPFGFTGMALTVRRLRSAGMPTWLSLLFFIPAVKLVLFVVLCIMPENATPAPKSAPPPLGKKMDFAYMLYAVLASILVTTVSVVLCTLILRDYGMFLFLGLPCVIGIVSSVIYSLPAHRTLGSCFLVSLTAVLVQGAALLFINIEGAICLIMAAPLALVSCFAGSAIGYCIQQTMHRPNLPPIIHVLCLVLPLAMGAETVVGVEAPLLKVQSSLIIHASNEKVWKNVVEFSELPPPSDPIFRLGIAYPIRAVIDGRGVGAIRKCMFSTGPFVEPITVWDQPNLLKFSVTQNPAPMEEWTPYGSVKPPHLDGFLRSDGGQFRLVSLPNGDTLLERTTWYKHHMAPAMYWQIWSDAIIHRIHMRVLSHIKTLSEK